jgi:hypothetical protein
MALASTQLGADAAMRQRWFNSKAVSHVGSSGNRPKRV